MAVQSLLAVGPCSPALALHGLCWAEGMHAEQQRCLLLVVRGLYVASTHNFQGLPAQLLTCRYPIPYTQFQCLHSCPDCMSIEATTALTKSGRNPMPGWVFFLFTVTKALPGLHDMIATFKAQLEPVSNIP